MLLISAPTGRPSRCGGLSDLLLREEEVIPLLLLCVPVFVRAFECAHACIRVREGQGRGSRRVLSSIPLLGEQQLFLASKASFDCAGKGQFALGGRFHQLLQVGEPCIK